MLPTAAWKRCLASLVVAWSCACHTPAEDRPAPPADAPRAAPPAQAPAPPPPATPSTSGQDARARPADPALPAAEGTVDLRRDEARGGHTIARHVGRTDAQLRARLARESISAASTYTDLEDAERVVALALAANERRVRRWVDRRGPRSNLAIRYRARDGLPTGRMLRRGDDAPIDVDGAVVVLRWRDDAYYVLTSYPEASR